LRSFLTPENKNYLKGGNLNQSASVPVLMIAATDDQVAAVDRAMRDAGHAAHCTRADAPGEIEPTLSAQQPHLILVFGTTDSAELAHAVEVRSTLNAQAPILLVTAAVDEDTMAAAMQAGARDVISLDHIERLQAVISREIGVFRAASELKSISSTARQYKNELDSLKQVTVDAIADIQEGIIVTANPAWLEIFGLPADTDLTGHPIMDYCAEADREALKGGLAACLRGKWSDESALVINAVREDGSDIPLDLYLENVEHEGEPAVRMLITPQETAAEETPEEAEQSQAPEAPTEPQQNQEIPQPAGLDPSTGLYGRQHFLGRLEDRLQSPPELGVRAIAYLRIDRFTKALEDVGLIGTEAVILQLSELLQNFIQSNDIYGRFGGTIFTVLLERGTMSDVEAWAEQFVKAVDEGVFDYAENSTSLTCTIGLCEIAGDEETAEKLLSDAERACRDGRSAGGNRIQLTESSGAAKQVREDDTVWVPRIRGALMENRLRLEHQPIGSLNQDIDGAFDTLVRMLDDDGNTIMPREFMDVAERTGLIKNIDRWVIGASMSFCASNQAKLVFVRLSRDSLKDDTLVNWVVNQAASTELDPGMICFEVSEEAVTRHFRKAQTLAETLRNAGFKFAVEHFGTGEDSARVLNLITLDFVKIDGSLMQGLHKNLDMQNRVKELARHAMEQGAETIAERVQDANTMAVLWQLGIAYIQGNYVQAQEIVIEDESQQTVSTQVLQSSNEEETA
jgi:diguanylate cyclase (GGDEF)-like protein/PAS domain S-box-containing protein